MNESTINVWIIDPHDPLIFRDGKPFGPTPGVRATSLPFPFPSTIAGGTRSQAGLSENGVFRYANDRQALAQLKKLQIRGPLLVELERDETGLKIKGWFVPAPMDALLFKHGTNNAKQELTIQQLLPIQRPGVCTDLDEQQDKEEARLQLVGRMEVESSKPAKQPPTYWNWNTFQTWLYQPSQITNGKPHKSHTLGIRELPRELRVHVSMDSETHTGKDGALFDTSGIEFTVPGSSDPTCLSQSRQFALAVLVDHNESTQEFQLQAGLNCLGSERRIVSWSSVETQAVRACPSELCISKELRERISTQKHCRLILLTPAYFANGFRPNWILQEQYKVHPRLRALAIQRPRIISGWDMAAPPGKQRKPSRRLAVAGTVLYISFAKDDDPTNIKEWINHIWMHCISDDIPNDKLNGTQAEAHDQYRLDGFGLAVLGTWDGERLKQEEQ